MRRPPLTPPVAATQARGGLQGPGPGRGGCGGDPPVGRRQLLGRGGGGGGGGGVAGLRAAEVAPACNPPFAGSRCSRDRLAAARCRPMQADRCLPTVCCGRPLQPTAASLSVAAAQTLQALLALSPAASDRCNQPLQSTVAGPLLHGVGIFDRSRCRAGLPQNLERRPGPARFRVSSNRFRALVQTPAHSNN